MRLKFLFTSVMALYSSLFTFTLDLFTTLASSSYEEYVLDLNSSAVYGGIVVKFRKVDLYYRAVISGGPNNIEEFNYSLGLIGNSSMNQLGQCSDNQISLLEKLILKLDLSDTTNPRLIIKFKK